jgi:hypothetical protein
LTNVLWFFFLYIFNYSSKQNLSFFLIYITKINLIADFDRHYKHQQSGKRRLNWYIFFKKTLLFIFGPEFNLHDHIWLNDKLARLIITHASQVSQDSFMLLKSAKTLLAGNLQYFPSSKNGVLWKFKYCFA